MKKKAVLLVSVIITAVAAISYFYLPGQTASHWNSVGEVDGFSKKLWTVIVFPAVSWFNTLLYVFLPQIEVRKENLQMFRQDLDKIFLTLNLFIAYIFGLVLWWNLIGEFNFNLPMVLGFSVLFWLVGTYIKNTKSNWFVGIRTPWTLSSEVVWQKTHQIASKLFKAASIGVMLTVFMPNYFAYVVLVFAIGIAVFSFFYSYLLYQKQQK